MPVSLWMMLLAGHAAKGAGAPSAGHSTRLLRCSCRLASFVIFSFFLISFSPPAQAQSEKTNLVIGLLLPPEEAEADSLRGGALLALEQANRTEAQQVRLIIRGRIGQWGADGEEAARMVLDDGAEALIASPNGAATHLALQVAGRTAVPVASLCPDSSVSRTGVPWMVRLTPTTIEEGRFLLLSLGETAGPGPWIAIVPDGRAGREATHDLKEAAGLANRKLERVYELNSSLTNCGWVVGQVVKDRPAGVLVWLEPAVAGKVARALRDAGFTGKVAGPSRCHSPAFVAASGKASEGFLAPGLVSDGPGQARWASFQAAFRQRYGTEADLTAAEAYDAALLLVHVVETHRSTLPKAFPLTFSLPGVSGNLSFDAEGNRKIQLELLVVRGGTFVAREPERK